MSDPVMRLDSREYRAWSSCLALTRQLEETLERRLQHDAGISHTDFLILVSLSEAHDRSLRMSVLADLTNFSQSRLSHAVSRLEEAGWVQRMKCSTDGRGQFAVLTDTGNDIVIAAKPGHAQVMRERFFNVLRPEQVDQLIDICRTALGQRTSH